MASKFDGRVLRQKIVDSLGITHEDYPGFVIGLYEEGMSGQEIADLIFRETGIAISCRSIQRKVRQFGKSRNLKESFNNAMARGRVVWQAELDAERRSASRHQISRKLRMEILERDGFKCVLCGHGGLLQVDHKIARVNGGEDVAENLRTLCIDCNIGKQQLHKEYRRDGTLRSGIKLSNSDGVVMRDEEKLS